MSLPAVLLVGVCVYIVAYFLIGWFMDSRYGGRP